MKISCQKTATVISSKISCSFRFILLLPWRTNINTHHRWTQCRFCLILLSLCVLRYVPGASHTPHNVLRGTLAPQKPLVQSARGHPGLPVPPLSPHSHLVLRTSLSISEASRHKAALDGELSQSR